ncbi:inositol 2-dehydrogenase [Cupriavidus basilensis]|uniref:Inositol 2-dehydrogenase n=1 Tax=Cupriavidus basilensis TaxID=68895 RepID=A0ABT6APQ8_9BURK|nr:inositol 2-dehydrogenase [Cupriavidus basilensis]MDF3834282.1 inositol 2-dehydrogenase [Cupriavidus basilensis]
MIRIAVLGAGRIGKIHAHNVAACPDAKLVVVADPFAEAASSLAAKLGCEATTDCDAAIARNDVDAIVIGTPTDTHIKFMLQAVEQGKAVLCEKPIDLDMGRSIAAAREVERLNGRVMLAFNRRFDPTSQAFRKAIDAGEVGEIRQVVISSRDPGMPPRDYVLHSGGIFRDMVIHDLDLARWLLGEEPVEVMAMGSRLVDRTLEDVADYDTVMVQLKTASGKQCHINCCREAVYGYDQRFEVFGAKGMLLQDNLRASTIRRWSATTTDAREPLLNFFLERYVEAYKNELEAFVAAVAANAPMPTTVNDGLQALRLADCALESVRTGQVVKV